VKLGRGARFVASAVCWIVGVAIAVGAVGAFAGGGMSCESGAARSCEPRTVLLIAGVAIGVAFGVAGAALYRPRRRDDRRKPWEY
jgi:hypothetical protein